MRVSCILVAFLAVDLTCSLQQLPHSFEENNFRVSSANQEKGGHPKTLVVDQERRMSTSFDARIRSKTNRVQLRIGEGGRNNELERQQRLMSREQQSSANRMRERELGFRDERYLKFERDAERNTRQQAIRRSQRSEVRGEFKDLSSFRHGGSWRMERRDAVEGRNALSRELRNSERLSLDVRSSAATQRENMRLSRQGTPSRLDERQGEERAFRDSERRTRSESSNARQRENIRRMRGESSDARQRESMRLSRQGIRSFDDRLERQEQRQGGERAFRDSERKVRSESSDARQIRESMRLSRQGIRSFDERLERQEQRQGEERAFRDSERKVRSESSDARQIRESMRLSRQGIRSFDDRLERQEQRQGEERAFRDSEGKVRSESLDARQRENMRRVREKSSDARQIRESMRLSRQVTRSFDDRLEWQEQRQGEERAFRDSERKVISESSKARQRDSMRDSDRELRSSSSDVGSKMIRRRNSQKEPQSPNRFTAPDKNRMPMRLDRSMTPILGGRRTNEDEKVIGVKVMGDISSSKRLEKLSEVREEAFADSLKSGHFMDLRETMLMDVAPKWLLERKQVGARVMDSMETLLLGALALGIAWQRQGGIKIAV